MYNIYIYIYIQNISSLIFPQKSRKQKKNNHQDFLSPFLYFIVIRELFEAPTNILLHFLFP